MIEANVIAWNEAETIHLTIKHYQKFCYRIVLWDNHSTDDTAHIARVMGCTVKTFGKPGQLSDRAYLELKNECWKKTHPGEDRRSWVIVVDADEILRFSKFQARLAEQTGVTIIKTQGWNIFSHEMPKEEWLEITNGHPDENYSKTIIFDPKNITDINFHIGCHVSKPKGNVRFSAEPMYLLHYRNVGGPQRLIERHNLYRPRMSEENRQRNWGHHYLMSDEQRVKEWESKYEQSRPFSLAGIAQS